MSLEGVGEGIQLLVLLYFVGLNGGYLILSLIGVTYTLRYMDLDHYRSLPESNLGLEPPISILAPAYNEEASIAASVKSLLQLQYYEYEVVVINDGSKDRTLEVLKQEFDLETFPEAPRQQLGSQPVRAIYHSRRHPNLRVIDKENGGKADSLNAGINSAHYALFCAVDADSILQRDSLLKMVQPFLHDPTTIASGGTVRIANGCLIRDGFLVETGVPSGWLARFQIVEYLRAFMFGRLGWSPLNALLIVSGAFGVFKKDEVIAAGGYLPATIGEDMELVVRLHRLNRAARRPYRITFVPDPVCWTEAPEDLKTLRNQRVRWQRGLGESLSKNREILFHPRGGSVGWLAFPFFLVFEFLGPLFEILGFLYMGVCFALGLVSLPAMMVFLWLSIGLGVLLSLSTLLMEEVSFQAYPRFRHLSILLLAALVENFGYRQLNALWRMEGLYRWAFGKQGHAQWGAMRRSGSLGR